MGPELGSRVRVLAKTLAPSPLMIAMSPKSSDHFLQKQKPTLATIVGVICKQEKNTMPPLDRNPNSAGWDSPFERAKQMMCSAIGGKRVSVAPMKAQVSATTSQQSQNSPTTEAGEKGYHTWACLVLALH